MRAICIGKDTPLTARVQLATEEETNFLLRYQQVVVAPELRSEYLKRDDLRQIFEQRHSPRMFMELPDGRLAECGVLSDWGIQNTQIDVSTFDSQYQTFVPGVAMFSGRVAVTVR